MTQENYDKYIRLSQSDILTFKERNILNIIQRDLKRKAKFLNTTVENLIVPPIEMSKARRKGFSYGRMSTLSIKVKGDSFKVKRRKHK